MNLYEPFFDSHTPSNKKYSVYVLKQVGINDDGTPVKRISRINFGDRNMQQFKDKTKLKRYSYLDHNDIYRRNLFLKRAMGIRDGNGKLTYNDPNSSNYYSINYLW